MKRLSLIPLVLLLALATFGLGCAKKSPGPGGTDPNPVYKSAPDAPTENSTEML